MKNKCLVNSMLMLAAILLTCCVSTGNTGGQYKAVQTVPETLLWKSRGDARPDCYYRIPALAVTDNGTVLAVADLRYDHSGDVGRFSAHGMEGKWGDHTGGIHKIDLVIKRSYDNGKTWQHGDTKITNAPSPAEYGFGDAAIVADRESDNVLILCVKGDARFGDYQRTFDIGGGKQETGKRLSVAKLISKDGGRTFSEPVDIANTVYGFNAAWGTLFFGSGRIMQSRFIKAGSHYRIYTALLSKKAQDGYGIWGNAVLYSDNFGETWNVLGNPEQSPVPNGDEAKIEELPDGSVILSSRKSNGRHFARFTYIDSAAASGTWEPAKECDFNRSRATNGEILMIKARKKADGSPVYLALQSLPAKYHNDPKYGNEDLRGTITLYWREVSKGITLEAFADSTQWKPFEICAGESAYSTMMEQKDGTIGFLYEKAVEKTGVFAYEHSDSVWQGYKDAYNIAYKSLSIDQITGGQYTTLFLGTGSNSCPYVATNGKPAFAADKAYYNSEKLRWK